MSGLCLFLVSVMFEDAIYFSRLMYDSVKILAQISISFNYKNRLYINIYYFYIWIYSEVSNPTESCAVTDFAAAANIGKRSVASLQACVPGAPLRSTLNMCHWHTAPLSAKVTKYIRVGAEMIAKRGKVEN